MRQQVQTTKGRESWTWGNEKGPLNQLRLRWAVLVVIGLSFHCMTTESFALQGAYQIERIATSRDDSISSIISQIPTITEDGRVLFEANLSRVGTQFSDRTHFLGDSSQLDVVASILDPDFAGSGIIGSLTGASQANQLGEVVFVGGRGGSSPSSFIWNPTDGLQPLYNNTGAAGSTFQFSNVDQPSINASGQVAFIASGQGLPNSVFTGDRNGTLPATALASTGGPLFEGFTDFMDSQITDSGEVIVLANQGSTRGIYRLISPGVSETIVDTNDALIGGVFGFDANNVGEVAFIGTLFDGTRALLTGDQSGIQLVARENVFFTPFFNEPGINDLGDLIFRGQFLQQEALFLGSDFANDQLIATGDLLFGEQVTQLFAGSGSINNRGQISFFALSVDPITGQSSSGIFLATPTTAVPEPSFLSLWLASAIGLLARRRGRQPS